VLFSQDKVATFVNRYFEPVWQSVRAVPIVRIDFGDGKVLTRTLHGNILTSVCTTEGELLDALPGIYAEDAYLDRLNQLRLLAAYVKKQPAKSRDEVVKAYHAKQAEALAKQQAPEVFAENLKRGPRSKSAIERPIEIVLQNGALPPAPGRGGQQKKNEVRLSDVDVKSWKELAEDTKLNETTRRRQIHELLASSGMVRPEKVTKPIYKDVLHADLDDPYLGLGKALFDTYPFAKEDGGK
jgi:hypothetical protein